MTEIERADAVHELLGKACDLIGELPDRMWADTITIKTGLEHIVAIIEPEHANGMQTIYELDLPSDRLTVTVADATKPVCRALDYHDVRCTGERVAGDFCGEHLEDALDAASGWIRQHA